jgi:hypothetical protein
VRGTVFDLAGPLRARQSDNCDQSTTLKQSYCEKRRIFMTTIDYQLALKEQLKDVQKRFKMKLNLIIQEAERIDDVNLRTSSRPVRYGGDDLDSLEQRLKSMLPAWYVLDQRLMFSRYQTDGAVATADDVARLTALLSRAPRSYRAFARDAASQWAAG